jgi:hypothetical protein
MKLHTCCPLSFKVITIPNTGEIDFEPEQAAGMLAEGLIINVLSRWLIFEHENHRLKNNFAIC